MLNSFPRPPIGLWPGDLSCPIVGRRKSGQTDFVLTARLQAQWALSCLYSEPLTLFFGFSSPFANREFDGLDSANTAVLRLLTHCSKEPMLGKGGFVLATRGSAGHIAPADNTLTPLPFVAVSNRGIE